MGEKVTFEAMWYTPDKFYMPCDIIKKSEPIFKNSRQITRDMNQFHGIFCFDEHSIQFFFYF